MTEEYFTYDDNRLQYLLTQNDAAAFTEIYNRYWKKLFVVAFNRIKEKETAEDIVHDVFTGLWNNRSAIAVGRLENYLAVAVKYAVISRLRKKINEQKYYRHASGGSMQTASGENRLHYKELLALVETEVEKLPQRCRLIYKYSRKEGMPVKEIARQLQLSPKTVENQLTKALRQLLLAVKGGLYFLLLALIHLFKKNNATGMGETRYWHDYQL